MWFWDPTYILVIIGVVLAGIASAYMRSIYNKYRQVPTRAGLTGGDIAQRILMANQVQDVSISASRGELTDHYSPLQKNVSLSEESMYGTSIAAVSVAAHEVGHALQHNQGYWALQLRSVLVPIVNLGSNISWLFILGGLIMSWNQTLINIGIFLFSAGFIFQVVTLPVEFNASKRAMLALEQQNLYTADELSGARKVLRAAALTYVAGAAGSLLQVLRLVLLFGNRNRRND